MAMKSISGLVFYVQDMDKTAEFYEKLGFTFTDREPNYLSIRLNWFWLDFHPQDKADIPEFQKEADLTIKGAGQFTYISVDNVDESYNELVDKGLQPDSQPADQPWGNREFLLRDPDGYKLVFFKKLG
jgi:catechol 2,3-dioxygenase-like lactoylglutathione lyase family enzyme